MSDSEEKNDQTEERDAQQDDRNESAAEQSKTERDKTLARLSDERREARERAQKAEAELEAIRKKQRDADEAKAKESGEFQKLLEQREKDLNELKASIAQRDFADLKRRIAAGEGLTASWATRIQGDDEDALRADAKAIAKDLKTREPSDTDAGDRTKPGQKRPDKKEFANQARWGIR